MSDTWLNSFGGSTIQSKNFGVWQLSANFAAPFADPLAAIFPFNTLVSGALAEYNTTLHELTVTRPGWYWVSWHGELAAGNEDNGVGVRRQPIIDATMQPLAEPVGLQPVASGFLSTFGIGSFMLLAAGQVVRTAFGHDAGADMIFGEATALKIIFMGGA